MTSKPPKRESLCSISESEEFNSEATSLRKPSQVFKHTPAIFRLSSDLQSAVLKHVTHCLRPLFASLKKPRGQCLIMSPDDALLAAAKGVIAVRSRYTAVSDVSARPEEPSEKLFFIQLTARTAVSYQALVYHYLELSVRTNCHVCLLSNNTHCLDALEKRVRSRFKHNIFFIPYLPLEESESNAHTLAQPFVHPSIAAREAAALAAKYSLPRFTHATLFGLLEPHHLALLLAAETRRVTHLTCISVFRAFVDGVPALRKTSESAVLLAYYDLLGAELIGAHGRAACDSVELRTHITSTRPLYVRQLLDLRVGRG